MDSSTWAHVYFHKAMKHSAYYDPITFNYLMDKFWHYLCKADEDILK